MGARTVRLALVGLLALIAGVSAAPPSSTAEAGAPVTITWKSTKRTLADGRTFFVRLPQCAPARATACREFLGRKRPLIVFMHAAQALEDRDTAGVWLNGFGRWSPDTISAFAVTKDKSNVWNAGLCCADQPVDDVAYLVELVDDVAGLGTIDRDRVGLIGLSNGGMLGLRAACEHPGVFRAVAALSAVYERTCDEGRLRIKQWHGAADLRVPLEGGVARINGEAVTIPPVVELAQRLADGSRYELVVIPARGHEMYTEDYRQATTWLVKNLPR